jgi:cellulose synthase/poly-beta-1,6-N-acetylglucosamine synthase-like glycosyltransferase
MEICELAKAYHIKNHPVSAYVVLSPIQKAVIVAMTALFSSLVLINLETQGSFARMAYVVLVICITILINIPILHRSRALPLASDATETDSTPCELLDDGKLPSYTVLVPLYREGAVVKETVANLNKIDYPRHKLQILLLIEEDDHDTRDSLPDLPAGFSIISIPASWPRTKPKALNHGLKCATGELLTVYDAEDAPDPKQLRLAASVIQSGTGTIWAAQAMLRIWNMDESWISALFYIEYAYWYELYLPHLERIGFPIPLGGTSNHIPTQILKHIGGWDAFNVTEDADLAIRIFHAGGKIKLLRSITYEKAPRQVSAWIKQRTRWIKGLIQTWLVHTRNSPSATDAWRFMTCHGGTILVIYIICQIVLCSTAQSSTSDFMNVVALGGLVVSVICTGLMYFAVISKHRKQSMTKCVLIGLLPYWILYIIANVRAIYQLASNPFEWEKTDHG